MSIVRYVDHTNGDDANSGVNPTDDPVGTGPKKHLQATIDDIMSSVISGGPLTQDCTINLAGTPDSPENYGQNFDDAAKYDPDADTQINLENFRIEGDGELIIQPTIWDNDQYESGEYPYTESSTATDSFDPKSQKPCILPLVMIKNTRNITFRGVQISREVSSETQYTSPGVLLPNNNKEISFHYCTVSDFLYGVYSGKGSDLYLYNCFVENCVGAVMALDQGFIGLYGQNYIENAVQVGILALNNSNVIIRSWDACPLEYYTTRISTTETRRDYTAIKAMVNSTVYIGMIDYIGDYEKPLLLQIVNEKEINAPGYYGVMLESKSLFVGAKFVCFKGKDSEGNTLFDDKPTVSAQNRFVQAQNEQTTITV